MQDRFKFKIYCKSENKMMLFNNPTLIDGDILQGGLLFKNYDHKITNCHEVNPEDLILMQCTGLKDKNGKLIFEGDIVKTNYKDIGIIKYSTHFCRWQIIFKQGRKHLLEYKEIGVCMFDFIYPKMHLEIIGNIYENPELLEVKND